MLSIDGILQGFGRLPSGPGDAITDVSGVRVGHATVWRDAPEVVRTGVTAIMPTASSYTEQSVFAGFHRYNGFGEVCGTHWLAETGVLTSPIMLTSSYSLGLVRDVMMLDPARHGVRGRFHHPLIAETNDGFFNAWRGGSLTGKDVHAALDGARGGPVAQGCVGGGTGMLAYGFKAGIGTASRIAETEFGAFGVGVLVQSNHGRRKDLRVDGLPVGRVIDSSIIPDPRRADEGSIVIVVATDAPLMAHQCNRLAQRAIVGLGRTGGLGHNSSGDFALAFSTGNVFDARPNGIVEGLRMLPNDRITPLFEAVVEATEAAIIKSMLAARDTEGAAGAKAWALTPEAFNNAVAQLAGDSGLYGALLA